jgi:hypothetical protein
MENILKKLTILKGAEKPLLKVKMYIYDPEITGNFFGHLFSLVE